MLKGVEVLENKNGATIKNQNRIIWKIKNPVGENRFGFAVSGGLITKKGHLIDRGWGTYGSALCCKTIYFKQDPIDLGNTELANCCKKKIVAHMKDLNMQITDYRHQVVKSS